jgi:hypothetical protein
MITKLLITTCLVFGLNGYGQTNTFIGKSLVGEVGSMCIEVSNGCAGETYFLEVKLTENYIEIKQKTLEIITCNKNKITYKNQGQFKWKATKGKIHIINTSTKTDYKLISLKLIEHKIIGDVEIFGKLTEIEFKEINLI